MTADNRPPAWKGLASEDKPGETDTHRILMKARYEGTPADALQEWNLWGRGVPIAQAGEHAMDLSDTGNMIRDDIRYLAEATSDPIVREALFDLVQHQEKLMKNTYALGRELMDVATKLLRGEATL
ncbi:hypothetical protein [Corynebacterium comes]|uniref:Uncharacterized protein n=1 Tax=Corynebacterium comes TaxID=2675218 RepID=A0A6B8WEI2_9CORY|nr:hypothetical protein [Corynebacterium comes]QGU05108.1 hypothetical protein CETAM_09275 [Corynebacterium comes]